MAATLLPMSISEAESDDSSSEMDRGIRGGRGLKKLVIAGVGVLAILAVMYTAHPGAAKVATIDEHGIGSLVVTPPAVNMGVPPAAGVPAAAATAVVQTRRIKPTENLNDGNACDSTEEEFEGLCYTKCSILTNNPAATRVDAFSCCPKASCDVTDVFNLQTASLIPCDGYDTSSTDGKSCPHKEGECLEDEEQFLGMCYEKCATLTNGKSPVRVGPASCCEEASEDNELGCLNPFEDDTEAAYEVGGGKGDGDPSTEATPHWPDKKLTEATTVQTP